MNSSRNNPQGYQIHEKSLRPTPVLLYLLTAAGALIVFLVWSSGVDTAPKMPSTSKTESDASAIMIDEKADRLAALENVQAATKATQPKGEISSMATDPYTRSQYPTTVAKFGKSIPAINDDRRRISEIAIKDPRCNGVSNAQVSSNSPKVNRRYWVECGNLTRLRFDQASIAKGEPVSVQTIQDMGRDGLITD